MGKEGRERIKEKLQELLDVIKGEVAEESKEIRNNVLTTVNEIKATVEEKWQDIEDNSKESLDKLVDKLDARALKTLYTVQDKYSEGLKMTEEFKKTVVSKWQDIEETVNNMKRELEVKALKTQYTIEEKVSQGLEKKDEVVVKTADVLVDTIEKVKCAITTGGCEEKKKEE